ncbi:hypothetical protein [Wolbachia endosymbiont of Pentalonia nigronervosa]|uniref:hypothetical protein n=1 Tax=Wolbachia endosymbiont of Pentalonia nigronervosa TaxID=1301914 RepID=UPI001CB7384F|nr:hypothetical protein [Wolbachia endosymbiont of Pentalonia nigronervosa]
MKEYTLRVDSHDLPYKKLIKLPTTYYRLTSNGEGKGYTIHSHNNPPAVVDINFLKLKWDHDINKIVLYYNDSALKIDGKDFIIEQEAFMSNDQKSIAALKSGKEALATLGYIQNSEIFAFNFFISDNDGSELEGTLNHVKFYDDSDPLLQNITKKTDGLYFTLQDSDADNSRNVYLSDKNGKIITGYEHYKYQYKPGIEEFAVIDNLIKSGTHNTQQNFVLEQGQELSDGIYEAKIVLNGKHVATLPEVGYHMLDDVIVVRNHITKNEVKIPRDFHYLKTVKPDNDDHKLAFCNFLGNEFFEHKKYDPQYHGISDKHKFVNSGSIKNTRDLKLNEYAHYTPRFFAAAGPESQNYAIDLFELAEKGKGEKVGTLADEFGYFESNGQLKYHNYHEEKEHVYDPSKVNIEMAQMKNINSEFYLMEGDNTITLHTIPELF